MASKTKSESPSAEMLGKLWHTIGMDEENYRRPLAWWLNDDNHRNRYCTPLSPLNATIAGLVARRLMALNLLMNGGRDGLYVATEEGIRVARKAFFAARRRAKAEGSATP